MQIFDAIQMLLIAFIDQWQTVTSGHKTTITVTHVVQNPILACKPTMHAGFKFCISGKKFSYKKIFQQFADSPKYRRAIEGKCPLPHPPGMTHTHKRANHTSM